MSDIGFIGLGLMGDAMVQCLQKNGHALTVVANTSRANVEAAVARGATEVKTAREVAAASDIVMLCMGTSEQVESRMHGDDGVIAGLRPGAVVIDFGTSLPASTRALGEAVKAAGGRERLPSGRAGLWAHDQAAQQLFRHDRRECHGRGLCDGRCARRGPQGLV